MKIALVAQQATPFPNTEESDDDLRLRHLCRSLARDGHRVTVYSGRHGAADGARRRAGLRVMYIPPPGIDGANDGADDGADPVAQVPAFADCLHGLWARDRPDVVHALRWTGGLCALAAAGDLDVPVVETFCSLGLAERRYHVIPPLAGGQRIRLERAIGRTVDAVVAASHDEEADLTSLGVPRGAISVVPCGVDTGHFTPDGPVAPRGERPRLLVMAEHAGHQELTTVFRALSRVPDAELVVAERLRAGVPVPAQAWRELAALAASLSVGDRVAFLGGVSHGALPALLRSADVFIAAAGYDPTGMLALRAMACGKPVIVTGGGGQADAVVDGTTGVLVPPGHPALLAHRIRRLLTDPMRLRAFGAAAADRARSRFSWDRIADETLAVYDRVLRGDVVEQSPRGVR